VAFGVFVRFRCAADQPSYRVASLPTRDLGRPGCGDAAAAGAHLPWTCRAASGTTTRSWRDATSCSSQPAGCACGASRDTPWPRSRAYGCSSGPGAQARCETATSTDVARSCVWGISSWEEDRQFLAGTLSGLRHHLPAGEPASLPYRNPRRRRRGTLMRSFACQLDPRAGESAAVAAATKLSLLRAHYEGSQRLGQVLHGASGGSWRHLQYGRSQGQHRDFSVRSVRGGVEQCYVFCRRSDSSRSGVHLLEAPRRRPAGSDSKGSRIRHTDRMDSVQARRSYSSGLAQLFKR
jgi:hypothetical protein